jgi:mersacidin/lichenicidin family type 2 lantibiotic
VKTKDVIRAWKDAGYRQNLSEADRAKLPAHPAGMIELTDADLGVVSGGRAWYQISEWCTGDCPWPWE